MIVRIFRVKVRPGLEDDWRDRVERLSIPWLKSLPGLIAYYPGGPMAESGDRTFCMVAIFDRLESVVLAVGENWRRPVLLGDEAELVEETDVAHFELYP